MEKYLQHTKAYLGILQSSLDEKEFERSNSAGDEMYKAIAEVSESHKLTMREMLNATLVIHMNILETIMEQLGEE